MHIGIVGPCSSGPLAEFLPDCGGVDLGCGGYSVVELARALVERGHRLSIITLSTAVSEPTILRGPQLSYYVYPSRLKRRMRDLYRVERQGLREGILLAKPDILHAHWTYEFALASLETQFPTVVTARDSGLHILRLSKDFYRLSRLYIQLKVLRKARFVTAVSPYLAESLQWLTKAKIEVIPNIIQVPSENDSTTSLDFSASLTIVTIMNGWGNIKNPTAAIKAFSLLRHTLPCAQMFMYGSGYEMNGPAARWANKQRLADNIHFCGPAPRSKLLRHLKTMSILLHPSVEESFGMALVEAMALGVPVVGGKNSGAVPWILDNGRAGFLTNVRSPEKTAQTLLECIQHENDREERRQNAYQRLANTFSPAAVSLQYEKVYERTLRAHAA